MAVVWQAVPKNNKNYKLAYDKKRNCYYNQPKTLTTTNKIITFATRQEMKSFLMSIGLLLTYTPESTVRLSPFICPECGDQIGVGSGECYNCKAKWEIVDDKLGRRLS